LPPPVPSGSVLICAGSNQDVFADLKSEFVRLDVLWEKEAPECLRAQAAVGLNGRPCLQQEQDCSTPRFIDGKPVDTPESPYDHVVLFWTLQHGSLSVKNKTTKETVSSPASQAMPPGAGGRRGGGGGRGGYSTTKVETITSSETGYSGEVFLFEPRPGQLQRGRQFTDLKPSALQDLVRKLVR
jgi:hypothetical protein